MTINDFKHDAKGSVKFLVYPNAYELKFERYYISEQVEKIRVIGKTKDLLISCDRPAIRL